MHTPNPHHHTPSGQPRARALGLVCDGTPGPANAITDVPGVAVGYTTLVCDPQGAPNGPHAVRTGVTAVLPRGREGVGQSCAAGVHSFNGNGELTGAAWIEESGSLALPILITNTHAVGACHRGAIDWVVRHKPDVAAQWLLPVVGETWDGYLNDINGTHVTPEHAQQAIDKAHSGTIEEGSVGGGTGMNCYAFKGGSGTSSRWVTFGQRTHTVGVFVQANFGARHELTLAGVPLGQAWATDNPMDEFFAGRGAGAGSCIAVVATDAPLLPAQCKALARRVTLGLGRTGAAGSHFSGDLFVAFSTANAGALNSRFHDAAPDDSICARMDFIPWGHMDAFYAATVQATEEAVLNALVCNASMVGRNGHRSPALPHAAVAAAVQARRAMAQVLARHAPFATAPAV